MRMDRRPMSPLNRTVVRMIARMVTVAVMGASLTLFQAAGARLKPMRATMAPVTVGGMIVSIQRAPATWTIAPMSARSAPTAMTPPSADPAPWEAVAAVMGAMRAKLEPR